MLLGLLCTLALVQEDADEIRRLIQALGADSLSVREEADRKLVQIGGGACDALVEAANKDYCVMWRQLLTTD